MFPKRMVKILLMFGIGFTSCTMNPRPEPLILAHRGVPFFAPESTLPSYMLARDLGAHYLEADLQRSSDSVLFILHDDDLSRTTNIATVFPDRAHEAASTFTWNELQQLDAGSWFNDTYPELARSAYSNLKLLSLNELIDIAEQASNKVGLYIETKHPENFPGIERQLKEILSQRGWFQKELDNHRPAVILQSFSPESIALLAKYFPETPITFLLWQGTNPDQQIPQAYIDEALAFSRSLNIRTVGVSFSGDKTHYSNFLTTEIIDQFKRENLQIHAYTFDTEQDIARFAPLVNGHFTNRTDLQLDYLGIEHDAVNDILARYNY